MMRGVAIALLALLVSACTGTTGGSSQPADDPQSQSPEPVVTVPAEPGPDTVAFHLDVTNQSFDEPEVRLRIVLDGRAIIDGVFPVEHQHHVVRHDFHLDPGSHDILVTEPGTRFELARSFTLRDEAWANVSYWGSSGNGPRLDWQFSREELVYA